MTLFNDNEHELQGLTTPSSDFLKEMVPVGFELAIFRNMLGDVDLISYNVRASCLSCVDTFL